MPIFPQVWLTLYPMRVMISWVKLKGYARNFPKPDGWSATHSGIVWMVLPSDSGLRAMQAIDFRTLYPAE